MKAIMISDHAKWCALMMNGIKNIEVRKSKALAKAIQKLIDKYGYADIYVYCTKDNQNLLDVGYADFFSPRFIVRKDHKNCSLNGEVVFKFRCYKVEHFEREYMSRYIDDYYYDNGKPLDKKFYEKTCLTEKELFDYIGSGDGYAIHISNLEIFDRPREVWGFCKVGCVEKLENYIMTCPIQKLLQKELPEKVKQWVITKAPQNYCYIEMEN